MDVGLEVPLSRRSTPPVKREVVNAESQQHHLDVCLRPDARWKPDDGLDRRFGLGRKAHRGERMTPRPKTAGADELAQTSVRFPRPLLKRARIRAATDEISFQALLISALDAELERREKIEARRARRSKVATTTR
jgi:hypothetical protein